MKVRLILLALHEINGHLPSPSPLGFIKDCNVLNRWFDGIMQTFVAEMVNHLNESLHFAVGVTLSDRLTHLFGAQHLVPGQSFLQYGDQGAIA